MSCAILSHIDRLQYIPKKNADFLIMPLLARIILVKPTNLLVSIRADNDMSFRVSLVVCCSPYVNGLVTSDVKSHNLLVIAYCYSGSYLILLNGDFSIVPMKTVYLFPSTPTQYSKSNLLFASISCTCFTACLYIPELSHFSRPQLRVCWVKYLLHGCALCIYLNHYILQSNPYLSKVS